MHPNQCLWSTKSAALGYTEGMEVVYFTAPLKICSFLPLAEPCFQFHETRSDSLGLPVGLPCLHLAPRGAGPATGSTACGIALLANAGAVHPRGCPEVSLGRVWLWLPEWTHCWHHLTLSVRSVKLLPCPPLSTHKYDSKQDPLPQFPSFCLGSLGTWFYKWASTLRSQGRERVSVGANPRHQCLVPST